VKHGEWKSYRSKGHARRLAPFVVVSLLFYLLLLPALWNLLPDAPPPRETRSVGLRPVSKSQWKKNARVEPKPRQEMKKQARLEPPKPPEPEKPKPEPPKPQGQIVDLAMPEQEEKPDEAKYVSQYDTKVKKETKARDARPAARTARKVSNTPAPPVPPMPVKPEDQSPDQLAINNQPAAESKPTRRVQESLLLVPKLKMETPLQLTPDGTRGRHVNKQGQDVSVEGNAERMAMMIKRAENDAAQGDPGEVLPSHIPRHLLPSLTSAMDSSGAPMNDYLPSVEESDETGLNSRAFKYATFFNRIKKKIAQQWKPADAQQRYDPTFSIHGYQSRYTVLYIVLDDRGNMVSVEVQRTSGVDFLDQEALSAVAAAAPFPNPPPGVVEEDGKIRFPFGFYFQINRNGFPFVGR
jgi:TonB family protein